MLLQWLKQLRDNGPQTVGQLAGYDGRGDHWEYTRTDVASYIRLGVVMPVGAWADGSFSSVLQITPAGELHLSQREKFLDSCI